MLQIKILPANTNQALAIIRLKKQEYVNYISYYLQSKIIKNMINGSKSIDSQPNLSLAKISNIKVKLPINDDLRNIKLLKLIDNKITTQKKIIESKKILKLYQKQKDYLLNKRFLLFCVLLFLISLIAIF